jgi:AcrR family transcriptional regulator
MPIRQSAARRERLKEHARRDILLAAAEVFARRGYAAATLAELAEAAGFAAASLYRYFASKEEMFRSLLDLVVREMDATFEEPVDRSLPLAARLEALLRRQYATAENLRSAFAVLDAVGAEVSAIAPRLASPRAGLDYYTSRLLAWLRRNVSRDELREPPEVVARAFAGIAFAFRRRPGDETPRSAAPESARSIVALALHGVAAPAPRRRGATP